MKIGIPRALVYWKQPYFWETFFENLDFEVLLSPLTNKEIVKMGVKAADPETCFSNKVYWGHLLWLEDKCDLIFIPRLKTNEERLEYCPKFFGLPDLAKLLVKTKILSGTFDEKKEKFERTLERLGQKIKRNKRAINQALGATFLKGKELEKKERENFFGKINSKKPKIILISHPYNLFDEYVNLTMKDRLEKLGAMPIFLSEIPIDSLKENSALQQLVSRVRFHWEFGKEIMDKIRVILEYKISGVIELSSFNCGCDAVLKEFVEKEFKTRKIPFLYLIIDEHTGEAGFQTRIEAFMDTIT